MSMSWAQLYKNLIDRSIIVGNPASGFFELTARCSFHCKMCYVCSVPDDKAFLENELTASQWISLGRQARDAGLIFMTLTGGEIFMRKDFFEIYEALSEMGMSITLYTNGGLIDAEKAHRLGKRPPSKVSITLYGASPETYGRVTGHPEGFHNTVNAIKLLLAENIKVELKTTVIDENSSEFEEIYSLADSLGGQLGIVNYVAPRREGCGTDPENCRLGPLELARYEKMIQDFRLKLMDREETRKRAELSVNNDVMTDGQLNELVGEIPHMTASSAFRCTAGKGAFWLTWDGRLTPCGLLTDPWFDVKSLGFSKSWELLKKSCLDVPSCKECDNCDLRSKCMACPARLKVETGSFTKPAPYLCETAKARKELDVEY